MTYFADLSNYVYGPLSGTNALTRNVGWLSPSVAFSTGDVDEEFMTCLWQFCTVSIVQTRGLHECEFCRTRAANVAERRGQQLLLGSAEIRVFSKAGDVYAAPNLIYHYVDVHHYLPPAEFIEAVQKGPRPPDQVYFEKLSELGERWSPTLKPDGSARRFRFVKTAEGVVRFEE
jgi:hypothetical protein